MSTTFPIEGKATGDVVGFVRALTAAKGATIGLQKASQGLQLALVGAAVIGMGSAIQSAAEYERELIKIETLVGVNREQVQGWGQDMLELAPRVGKTAQELSRAMFAISSGGERGSRAMEILESSAKASAIGLGDVTTIGRTATAALQAFGDEGLTAANAVGIMTATVREGNIESTELAGSLGRVIGIADTVGSSFEEVNAFIATYTRLGVGADIATTALRGTMATLIRPTQEAREQLERMGTSIEEVRAKVADQGLAQTLVELMDATDGNLDAIGALVPNVRALAGVLGTAGSQADTYLQILKNIQEVQDTIVEEGFERTQEGVAQGWARIKASANAAGIAIGETLVQFGAANVVDDVAEVATEVAGLARAWNEQAAAFERWLQTGEQVHITLDGIAAAGQQISRTELLGFDSAQADELSESAEGVAEAMAKWRQESERFRASRGEVLAPTRLNEQTRAIEQTTDALIEERAALVLTGRQLLAWRLARQEATQTEIDAALRIYDSIEAHRARIVVMDAEKRRTQELMKERERAAEQSRAFAERARQEMRDAQIAAELDAADLVRDARMERFQDDLRRMTNAAQTMSEGVGDALVDIITQTESVGDAFGDMVDTIIRELARLAVEQTIIRPLLGALTSAFAPGISAPGNLGTPNIPIPVPNFEDIAGPAPLGALGAASAASGAVTVNYSPVVNAFDQRGVDAVLQSHGGRMAQVVVDTINKSGAMQGLASGRL